MNHERQFCTFYLDDLFLGVEVQRVQEVIRFQKSTRVPRAAAKIAGLINLRGQIVTAIDLRALLELPASPEASRDMNVVLRTDDGGVSLLVDDIGDVLELAENEFERPPETVTGANRNLIRGEYKLADKLLLALDTERILEAASATAASED